MGLDMNIYSHGPYGVDTSVFNELPEWAESGCYQKRFVLVATIDYDKLEKLYPNEKFFRDERRSELKNRKCTVYLHPHCELMEIPIDEHPDVFEIEEEARYDVNMTEYKYWRKFNALHAWLSDRLFPDGEDNCVYGLITQEIIDEFLEITKDLPVSQNEFIPQEVRDRISEAIPPTGGFFFGSTEISDYYWELMSEARGLFLDMDRNKEDVFIYTAWY